MQITKMTATFGKLQNAELTLSSGLNCIYAPNESGKSTWSRFLLNMCYGVSTRDRSPLADKVRYLPWNGGTMQGRMDITAGGKAYTITRTTKRANAPMGAFSCTYTGTADEVPGIGSTDAGLFFLGVPREVYERSAFIGQNALAVNQDPELERRITALITTGEEETSYSETYDRLKKQLNRRKHNRTGQIPVLETEIAALRQQSDARQSIAAEIEQIGQQIETTQQRLLDLQGQQALWQQIDAQNRYRQSLRQRQEAETKLQELRDKSTAARAVMEAHPLHGAEDASLQQQLHPTPPKKPLPAWLPFIFSFLALIAGAVFYFVKWPLWSSCTAIGAAVVLAVCAAVLLRRKREYQAVLNAQAVKIAALQQQIREYQLLQQASQNAAEVLTQYRALYDTLPQVPAVPLNDLPVPALAPEQAAQQLTAAQESSIRLRSRLDMLTGQIRSMDSAETIHSQLIQKRDALLTLQTEYDAIAMAMEALAEANATLQSRFSPALGERAAEIFGQITGGQYQKVLLSRDFSIAAENGSDSVARNLSLLSQGTADQLYLSVRLAICDMVLPQEDPAPLILDDALLSFDDTRLHAALDFLAERGKTRQILLFSCQKREQDYLREREGVTLVEL